MKNKKLIVGVSEFPPLVFKAGDTYTGFEIDIWEKVAKKLALDFEYKEYTLEHLLKNVEENKVDVAIAGITRTEARENVSDFSHYTMNSGLSIMISKKSKINIYSLIKDTFHGNTKNIFITIGIIAASIFGMSNIIWILERGHGAFAYSYYPGIFDALWWVFTSMTAVGYGDYIPITLLGRFVAVLVIFLGLFVFGVAIAQVTSLFTLKRLTYKINSFEDLSGKKVATKEKTASVFELEKIGASVSQVKNLEGASKLLQKNEVDAVVFDTPVLLHFIKNDQENRFVVLENMFALQTYGFAFKRDLDELHDEVNAKILEIHDEGDYELLYRKWFGKLRMKVRV